ncbi:MAG: chromosome segregation protein SMC [Oscillospiraceae bacterium]|nr:chromosome segregation protein SMC [Oscillospiraceae bacterium]
MYLKALEIQGFKSFPDKTVLSFNEPITAIVGPNGSGKSNISDAIRWVMGEQSTKALRGGKMEDVIFGGTLKRKQTGYAEVSLILDNSAGLLSMEESEVMVTRRYYRSGDSEYYINRQSCRLRDINELFMDTGLGREGYSIIGQGKIDEILSTRGQERRAVFEEAAGISRFRHRKEEAERKLEKTADNLTRIGDKISELELQVEPLRQQAEKAREYLVYRDELRGLEISVWMEQLDRLRQNNRKLLSDYEEACRQRDEAAAAQAEFYARSEELSAQMRELDVEADRLRTVQSGLAGQAAEQESEIAILKNQIQNNLENAQRLNRELDQQEGRADSVAEQIAQREARLAQIRDQRQESEQELSQLEQKEKELSREVGKLSYRLEALRQREAMETASAADARALLSALAAAQQEVLDRETAVESQLQENSQRLAGIRQESEDKQAELDQAKEKTQELTNQISGYQLRHQMRQRRLEACTDQANRLLMEDNNLQSRIHMLSEMEKMYEGYSKAVKVVMQAAGRGQLKNIHGPVASLLRVSDEYTLAIEIALGGAMQNIVVERSEDGKAAIEYLKRRDGGRATFLPISDIRPGQLNERGLEEEYGFVGVASQLIRYDSRYEKIFSNLLGRVVICEEMSDAIRMARKYGHRFKIVTLDGQVVNPGGSMTGGSANRNAGILSRAGELERLKAQAAGVSESLEKARKILNDAKRETAAAAYEVEAAQSAKREQDDLILRLEGEMGQYRILIGALEEQIAALRSERDSLTERSRQVEEDSRQAEARIAELDGKAQATREESAGAESGQSEYRARQDRLTQQISALRAEQAALEAEEGAVMQALGELRTMARDISGDRETRLDQIREYEERNDSLRGRIQHREQALTALRQRQREQEQIVEELNRQKLELEGQRNRADRSSREKGQELVLMERECAQLESRKAQAATEEKQLLDKLWDNYELSYDGAKSQRQELESMAKASRRIGELKRKISSLGHVNVGAIDDFKRVNERYEYLTGQRDDVEKAKRELETIIGGITSEMEKIFSQQFSRIGEAFALTFTQLFGGGKATLELSDPKDILNCDIEIKVQPPGKALKILSLLSGGEKAFVAIALYFAFLKVRPTPFVVMDEIEAALDESNVVRFARYMRGMTDRTQFICITHRRGTMEEADVLYGVTMQEKGVSKMLTINLNDVEKELGIKSE